MLGTGKGVDNITTQRRVATAMKTYMYQDRNTLIEQSAVA